MQQFPDDLLKKLHDHLTEEKKKLVARIGELTKQDPFSDPDRTNDNAASDMEASEESDHDRVSAIVDELKIQVASIEKALERVADGSYGFCSVCGTMIDTDRLSVVPTATLCLTHEKEAASKQKITA